ncbi:MAG: DUF3426 domain-containing protein [Betaproteobacteria bacterium]
MQSITHCPACQTQFVVTEEQLNQHNGTVRCGHCLHVFNATEHLVGADSVIENNSAITESAVTEEIIAAAITPIAEFANEAQLIETKYYDENLAETAKSPPKISAALLWLLVALLVLTAAAQSLYFLRHQIAIYYPNAKPLLVQACKFIGCLVDLPQKIELIVIDDSDIQEDADHIGLMRLSSTLINQAGFNQAYPNLELTLTDVEDKPILRRIFKPIEYLPASSNIDIGLAPGEEVKVKLAITTQGVTVAGYRVFVSY